MRAPSLRPETSDTPIERVWMYVRTRRCMYVFSHLLRISVHLCCIFVLLLRSLVGALQTVVMNDSILPQGNERFDSSTGEAEIRMQAPRLRPRTASDTGHERVCMYVCTRRCMYMFSHLLRISVHLCCIFVLLLKSFVGALPIVVMNADASRLRPRISITKSWQEVMAVLTGYALNNPTWAAKSRLRPRETSHTAIEHVCFYRSFVASGHLGFEG